jgi:hypothetical protein
VCCTKALGFLLGLSSLLNGLDVCAMSQEPFLAMVEQSSPGVHGSLQVEVSFPTIVELEAENLPPLGADF